MIFVELRDFKVKAIASKAVQFRALEFKCAQSILKLTNNN